MRTSLSLRASNEAQAAKIKSLTAIAVLLRSLVEGLLNEQDMAPADVDIDMTFSAKGHEPMTVSITVEELFDKLDKEL